MCKRSLILPGSGEVIVQVVQVKNGHEFSVYQASAKTESMEKTLKKAVKEKVILSFQLIRVSSQRELRNSIMWLNAEKGLLGVNYPIWPWRKKVMAHVRIWICKIISFADISISARFNTRFA